MGCLDVFAMRWGSASRSNTERYQYFNILEPDYVSRRTVDTVACPHFARDALGSSLTFKC
jgi:hypothetical protein